MASCVQTAVLFLLLVNVRELVQEPAHQCIATLTVPRNTVWRAAPMQLLKINCTVTTDPHCWKHTSVYWCKVDDGNDCKLLNHSSHTTTEWRNNTGDKRILFLIFRNLSASHSGIYRCKVDAYVSTVSHNVNVTVTEPAHQCIATLTVPRNTVWRAAPMQLLKINCTVTTDPHCWNHTSVSWCKVDDGNDCKLLNHSSHTTTEWRNNTGDKRILFLIFRNLSASHSGIYRCKVDAHVSTVSHNINVTVTDRGHSDQIAGQWMYVLCSTVTVVTLTLATMVLFHTINCKSKESKNFLEDEDVLTTVCYQEGKDSSLQDLESD